MYGPGRQKLRTPHADRWGGLRHQKLRTPINGADPGTPGLREGHPRIHWTRGRWVCRCSGGWHSTQGPA